MRNGSALSTSWRKKGMQKQLQARHTSGHQISLVIGDNTITTNYAHEIKHTFASLKMRAYIIQKHNITHNTLQNIDFDAISYHLQKIIFYQRQKTLKKLHSWLPVGKMTSLFDK